MSVKKRLFWSHILMFALPVAAYWLISFAADRLTLAWLLRQNYASVQDFRRQYSVTTFNNSYSPYRDSIPERFDERYYALREGLLGGAVTSPSTEIAGDLTQVRLDWLNRWQTKRGPVGNRHIIDWITLDTGVSLYPKKEQDYGKFIGLVDYDARWHVGDRFSVLSSG
ncbi:MAG: hypothetical protein IK141_05040, partial [Clostridia bacterium]|nr:hypothetical protein [Clostridia bacterium]